MIKVSKATREHYPIGMVRTREGNGALSKGTTRAVDHVRRGNVFVAGSCNSQSSLPFAPVPYTFADTGSNEWHARARVCKF